MDQLAGAAAPILKLRGNWTVVDPAIARKARKRLVRTVKPAQAVAAALTGVVQVDAEGDGPRRTCRSWSAPPCSRCASSCATPPTREPIAPPAALRATLRDYQRHGLTWLAELTSLGLGACLADDMGLGKTVTLIALHLHRVEAGATGPTLVVCPASLLGNWEDEVAGSPRACRCAASTAAGARWPTCDRGLRAHHLRHDAARPRGAGRRATGTWSSPTRPSTSRTPLLDRAGAAVDPEPRPGRADRHPGREQPDRALGDPRLGDPGPARQPQRVPQGVGRRRSSPGCEPSKAAQFPELIGPVPAAPPQVRPRHRARAARPRPRPTTGCG